MKGERSMNKEHYSELITLSQEIYNDINKKLTAYLDKTYGSIPENTMAQQMEDYLFVAEESTGYVLGTLPLPATVPASSATVSCPAGTVHTLPQKY